MSHLDDPTPVDGAPGEPEAKAQPARRPATKKASSRSGASRSARSRSGEGTGRKTGKAAASKATKATGGAKATSGAKASGAAKASATARKRAPSTRRRSSGLARGSATATAEAPAPGEAAEAGEAAVEPEEATGDPAASGGNGHGGAVVDTLPVDEPTAEIDLRSDVQLHPEVELDAEVPLDDRVTEQSVTEQSVTHDPVPPATVDVVVDDVGEAAVDEAPEAPAHDAWLALDDADRVRDEPVADDEPRPRWSGRWTADAEGGMVPAGEALARADGDAEADTDVEEQQEGPAPAPDPAYLATLPPPPTATPPVPSGERPRPVRSSLADTAVRASAWTAAVLAGRRRPVDPAPPPETGPVETGAGTDDLDPEYLATLPPPPAPPAEVDADAGGLAGPETGALDRLTDWSLPDWSVSGTGEAGSVVDLAVSDVNSDRAVLAPPATEPVVEPATEPVVAPVVEPDGTAQRDEAAEPVPGWVRSRHQRRKEWRRVERARRYAARRSVRFPIFTRSILLWMVLFALSGMAAGGTAAVFWTHFNTQIAELREETQDFDRRSEAAEARIEGLRNEAVAEIENRMKELAPALAEPRTVQAGKLLSPYVWFVSTLDEAGVASVGTAFSVASDQRSTWLLTSFNVVRAGTVRPAPPIKLRKDPEEVDAELVSWDAANDLALIRMDRGSQPTLDWAAEDVQAKLVGNRLYIVTGFGGAGATLNSAMTIDQNSRGLLHDGRIGTAAQGGPIVTTDGKVVGVASLVYQPLGFDPGELHYAASIRRACDVLLTCTMEARRVRPPG